MSVFEPEHQVVDPLYGPSRTWDPNYDDPTFRALVEQLGSPLTVIEGVIVATGQDGAL